MTTFALAFAHLDRRAVDMRLSGRGNHTGGGKHVWRLLGQRRRWLLPLLLLLWRMLLLSIFRGLGRRWLRRGRLLLGNQLLLHSLGVSHMCFTLLLLKENVLLRQGRHVIRDRECRVVPAAEAVAP